MSTFDTNAAEAINSAVRRTRAKAIPAQVEARAVPRMSIDELNSMDFDTLRDRYLSHRRDDRGPVERFLDILDVPRNTLFGVLAPGLERRARSTGNTGSFGRGRVNFSDILDEAGVGPGIARGILGFVGDVAFDPLTYAGGVGIGAKVATKGGRLAAVGKPGVRAVRGAEKAIKAGKPVEGLLGGIHEAAGKPQDFRRAVFGGLEAGSGPVSKARDAVSRVTGKVFGHEPKGKGGFLAENLDNAILSDTAPEVIGRTKLASEFMEKYGIGAGPGIRVGRDAAGKLSVEIAGRGAGKVKGATSSIAHVPFTDIGLYVPAFTAPAASAAKNLAIASDPNRLTPGVIDSARIIAGKGVVERYRKLAKETHGLNEAESAFEKANEPILDAIRESYGKVENTRAYPLLEDAGVDPIMGKAREYAAMKERRIGLEQQMAALKTESDALLSNPAREVTGRNINDILALKALKDQHEALAADLFSKVGNSREEMGLRRALLANEAERQLKTTAVLSELAELDEAAKRGGPTKRVLTEPGKSLESLKLGADAHYIPPPEVDEPIALKQKHKTLEKMRGLIKGLPKDHPLHEQVAGLEIKLLKARDAFYNAPGGSVPGVGVDKYSHRSFLGIDPINPGASVVNPDLNVVGEVSEAVRGKLDEYQDALEELERAERAGQETIGQAARGEVKPDIRLKVETLRNELHQLTAPLRVNATATVDDVAGVVKDLDRASLTEANRRLLDMHDADAVRTQRDADTLMDGVKLATEASRAIDGSVISMMDPVQMRALGLQKQFLGTGDALVGSSTMVPFKTAADAIFGVREGTHTWLDAQGRAARGLFGGNSGEAGSLSRLWQYMGNQGAMRKTAEQIRTLHDELQAITAKHGLTDRGEEVMGLAYAFGVAERERQLGRVLYHTTEFGKTEKAGVAKILADATKGGRLANPALVKDLQEFAKRRTDMFDTIRSAAEEGGLLGPGRSAEGYLPNELTAQGREFLSVAKKSQVNKGDSVAKARMMGLQTFEHERGTRSARFQSQRLGREAEIWEHDRALADLTDEEIKAVTDADAQKWLAENKAAFEEYAAKPVYQDSERFLNNDPVLLNKLIGEGKFAQLLGTSNVPLGFFDQNLATAAIRRSMGHELAVARESFQRTVVPDIVVKDSIFNAVIGKGEIGKTVHIGNGIEGKVVPLGGGRNGVKIGDDVFRGLDPSVAKNYKNPMVQAMGEESLGALYHERKAEAIERAVGLFDETSEPSRRFWQGVDKLTGTWKTLTLMHPSWWIGNVIGDSINFTSQDPGFLKALAKYPAFVAKMFRLKNDPEALAKLTTEVNGAKITAADLWAQIGNSPVSAGGSMLAEPGIGKVSRELGVTPSRVETGIRGSMHPSMLKADAEQFLKQRAIADKPGTIADKAAAWAKVGGDRLSRTIREPWYRANTITSDMMRTLAYLSLRDQGWDHAQGVARLVEAGFDYSNMTKFESEWARRMIPFWAWLKNNGVYQAKLLMNRPIIAGSYPSLQRALEEFTAGEERVPMPARPQWMREQLAIQFGKDPSTRSAVTLGTIVPQEQAFLLGRLIPGVGGLQDAAKYAVSSINPLVRTGLEIGAGREFFSGRDIGGDTPGADLTPIRHILNQIRPLREAGKLASVASEQGVGAAAGRAVLGGRVQPFTDDRIRVSKLREFQTEEGGLRKAVRTAEFRGDKAASVARRAELLRLYETMLQQGYEEEVPKWARERLGGLSGR